MQRRGFTLIELTVVLVILLVLITLTLYWLPQSGDQSATTANSIVGACDNARQQAAKFNEIRGVRLILDSPDGHYATGVRLVGGPDRFEQATQPKQFETPPGSGTFVPNLNAAPIKTTTAVGAKYTVLSNLPPIWAQLEASGALDATAAELTISGLFYHISKVGTEWRTTRPVMPPYSNHSAVSYTLGGLHPTAIAGGRVTQFAKNYVIDLDQSLIPTVWTRPDGTHVTNMDILFAPNGAFVSPPIKDSTTLMLVVGHVNDLGKVVGDLSKDHDEKIVAVFRRGIITASSVDETDANNNGIADDPFNFAHRGKETK